MLKFKKERQHRILYNLYYSYVMNIVLKKTYTHEDAEDICSEVFVSFFNKLEEVENHKSWLYGAVKYALSNYYRKKSNTQKDNFDIDDALNDKCLQYSNDFNDTKILLQEIINCDDVYEDEKDRILFQLLAINNYSKKQTAMHLGLTRSQVDYRYNKIFKRITEILKQKGISDINELL